MKLKYTYSVLALFLVLSLLFCACGDRATGPSESDLQRAYCNAVQDAETAEPDEISRDLVAIVYYNNNLIWEDQPGNSRVLAVTWTSWDGYNNQVGQSITTTRDIWVTVVPEVKNFARGKHLAEDRLTLRLEQLVGVPPKSGKKWFVEIWANPEDIFRPSPDPDITDHEAELDFPKYVPTEYIKWFNDLRIQSYGENGYPWTRLGYTYDWGNPKSEIGLSEFVIKAGSEVTIHSVSTTSDYCK